MHGHMNVKKSNITTETDV